MFGYLNLFFHSNPLSLTMLFLILYMGLCIGGFSLRYMQGDSKYRSFFLNLMLLLISLGIMILSNHLALLWLGWSLSNYFLVRLMIHKPSWAAAKNSGLLAGKNFLIGSLCLAVALLLLFLATNEVLLTKALYHEVENKFLIPILTFITLAAMIQSSIWPFHRWLLSSLNSPTPVSALMHAGLINGGGFLLIRFAPLYFKQTNFLHFIFLIGLVSAILGSFWKLLQNDIKKMLACSTLGQMGFMMVQCGLGLFPAALAHLIYHGLFKAYLFLSSGGGAEESRQDLSSHRKLSSLVLAFLLGVWGCFCFTLLSGKKMLAQDATFILSLIAFLAATQSAYAVLTQKSAFRILTAFILTSLLSSIYGVNVGLISKVMSSMQLTRPVPLQNFHFVAVALLVAFWFALFIFKSFSKRQIASKWALKGYVMALNASQPHPKTVTPIRKHYNYF